MLGIKLDNPFSQGGKSAPGRAHFIAIDATDPEGGLRIRARQKDRAGTPRTPGPASTAGHPTQAGSREEA